MNFSAFDVIITKVYSIPNRETLSQSPQSKGDINASNITKYSFRYILWSNNEHADLQKMQSSICDV